MRYRPVSRLPRSVPSLVARDTGTATGPAAEFATTTCVVRPRSHRSCPKPREQRSGIGSEHSVFESTGLCRVSWHTRLPYRGEGGGGWHLHYGTTGRTEAVIALPFRSTVTYSERAPSGSTARLTAPISWPAIVWWTITAARANTCGSLTSLRSGWGGGIYIGGRIEGGGRPDASGSRPGARYVSSERSSTYPHFSYPSDP